MSRGALFAVPSMTHATPRRLDDYADKLSALADVSRLIAESLEPDEVAQRIVDSVRALFRIERSALYRLDESSGGLTLWAIADERPPTDPRPRASTFPSG